MLGFASLQPSLTPPRPHTVGSLSISIFHQRWDGMNIPSSPEMGGGVGGHAPHPSLIHTPLVGNSRVCSSIATVSFVKTRLNVHMQNSAMSHHSGSYISGRTRQLSLVHRIAPINCVTGLTWCVSYFIIHSSSIIAISPDHHPQWLPFGKAGFLMKFLGHHLWCAEGDE